MAAVAAWMATHSYDELALHPREEPLAGLDRDYVTDIALVMINLCYAMVGRLVDGTAASLSCTG